MKTEFASIARLYNKQHALISSKLDFNRAQAGRFK